ncbi:carbohydrate esterase family 16 protein [Sphaerobolus stellatus SS14]|nr:carbohydrate esterase family 16 protein [Sphaerobolus stellatus SS14]
MFPGTSLLLILLLQVGIYAVLGTQLYDLSHIINGPQVITAINRTQPIKLAISPACTASNPVGFAEINTGVKLNATKTIVAFGDSWTSNGSNGTIPFAPVVFPPNPSAGARFGNNERARASNGYVWPEALGNILGAKVIDYAVGGAVVDLSVWNTTRNGPTFTSDNLLRVGFVDEVRLFLQQGRFLSDLDPEETLYLVAFGINDRAQFLIGGGNWTAASDSYLTQLNLLIDNGARNFLIHWLYFSDPNTNAFQDRIFTGLQKIRTEREHHPGNKINFAAVNLAHLFGAVNSSMGVFGYNNYTCLASQNTTNFGCDDPDHSVFYIPGHPSAVTHELLSEYSIDVVERCAV